MLAYQTGLKPGTTRLVISPDSEFFRYFGDALGGALPATSPAAATPAPTAPVTSPAPASGG